MNKRKQLEKNYIKRRESFKKNYYEKTIGKKINNCLREINNGLKEREA
jgi:hypothetical protein